MNTSSITTPHLLVVMLLQLSMVHTIVLKFGRYVDTETLHWMKNGMVVCLLKPTMQ